jgi:hypothetical protein
LHDENDEGYRRSHPELAVTGNFRRQPTVSMETIRAAIAASREREKEPDVPHDVEGAHGGQAYRSTGVVVGCARCDWLRGQPVPPSHPDEARFRDALECAVEALFSVHVAPGRGMEVYRDDALARITALFSDAKGTTT